MGASGFPGLPGVAQQSLEGKKMAYNRSDPQVHHWLITYKLLQCGLNSIFIRVSQLSAIFFMQLGGLSGAASANGYPGPRLDGVAAYLRFKVMGVGCECASLRRLKPDLFNVRRDSDKECCLFEMWYARSAGVLQSPTG
jgi:hypothetical protein